ncbi:MAG: hypothetical protein IKP77_03525 [Acholeplasmatales bacterium]|nr:hypothetical protein [Acholeplasmatales bacterium]
MIIKLLNNINSNIKYKTLIIPSIDLEEGKVKVVFNNSVKEFNIGVGQNKNVDSFLEAFDRIIKNITTDDLNYVLFDLSSFDNNIFLISNEIVEILAEYNDNSTCIIISPIFNRLNEIIENRFIIKNPNVNIILENTSNLTNKFEIFKNKIDDGILFREYLLNLMVEKGYDSVKLYKKCQIGKSVFSRVVNFKLNPPHQPSKETVAALAIGLELSLPETEKFYNMAGYSLTKTDFLDKVIRFFIDEKIYDVTEINILLYHYNYPPLGEKISNIKERD